MMNDVAVRQADATDPTDAAFDILANRRRRALLDVLGAHEWPRTVADVAKTLAVRECDSSIEAVPGDAMERVYLALHHVHVPKLDAFGAVDHDPTRNTVALTERGRRLRASGNRLGERLVRSESGASR